MSSDRSWQQWAVSCINWLVGAEQRNEAAEQSLTTRVDKLETTLKAEIKQVSEKSDKIAVDFAAFQTDVMTQVNGLLSQLATLTSQLKNNPDDSVALQAIDDSINAAKAQFDALFPAAPAPTPTPTPDPTPAPTPEPAQ